MTLILSNDDVETLLTMRDCIEVMEEAYVELAHGRGVSRTRSDCFTPTSRADALYSLKSMDGVAPKLGVGAVRINSDIITWPRRGSNLRREKVPAAPNGRYVGLVLLFSVETGEPLAILPDGVMQRMRVGAANGLGIKYLAWLTPAGDDVIFRTGFSDGAASGAFGASPAPALAVPGAASAGGVFSPAGGSLVTVGTTQTFNSASISACRWILTV